MPAERAAVDRAADHASAGLRGPLDAATTRTLVAAAAQDPEPRVRSSALGALVRRAAPADARRSWRRAAVDADAAVRRRAAELAPRVPGRPDHHAMVRLVGDPDPVVREAAAWACGELSWPAVRADEIASELVACATHPDPLVREACVAALGALARPAGLPAILAATADRPAIRRRAVLALAPFGGPEVDAALSRALTDRDWQVRQAAEDLGAGSDDAPAAPPGPTRPAADRAGPGEFRSGAAP